MSPIEILNPAGPSAPSSPSVGRADIGVFAGLLEGQASQSRGRLGVGRWLEAQPETAGHRQDGADGLVISGLTGGLLDRPLVNPGPGGDAKTGVDGPLINPGTGAKVDNSQPLINPGPNPAKTDGAQVLPGVSDAKPQVPLVNPGEPGTGAEAPVAVNAALQMLAGDDQAQSVTALAQAAQRAVSRAPEVSTITPTTAATDVELPEPSVETIAVDADTTVAPSPRGEAAATASTASASAGPADPQIQGASARPDTRDLADVDPTSQDPLGPDPDLQAAPVRTEAAAPVAVARADAAAAVVGRMSFDALAQVSAQIIRRLETRTTRFDMELNPVELGRVDVRLDIDAEGRLAARLAFDNPAAALELRGRVDDLRRELQQAGFQLSDDAFSFTDRGGSGGGRGSDADDARRVHARSAEAADQIDAAAQPALRTMARLGLDVRV